MPFTQIAKQVVVQGVSSESRKGRHGNWAIPNRLSPELLLCRMNCHREDDARSQGGPWRGNGGDSVGFPPNLRQCVAHGAVGQNAPPRGAEAIGTRVLTRSRTDGARALAQRLGDKCHNTQSRLEAGLFGVTDVVPVGAPGRLGGSGVWRPVGHRKAQDWTSAGRAP